MTTELDTESLPVRLLQEKLYEALRGAVTADELFADLSDDTAAPRWRTVAALFRPDDVASFSRGIDGEEVVTREAFRAFVDRHQLPG